MGRKKLIDKLQEAAKEALGLQTEERNYKIRDAVMKDGVCNYSYEITKGVGYGDVHKVKGTALYLSDLGDAFTQFNVHMAFIDDAFKLSGIEVQDIDTMHNDDLAFKYNVTGFAIHSSEDNESIVLTGIKHVSMGHFDVKSPKIAIDNSSSYKWHNELKAAADKACLEVALYKEGKHEVVEEADEPDPRQTSMFSNSDVSVSFSVKKGDDEFDEDFANAAL